MLWLFALSALHFRHCCCCCCCCCCFVVLVVVLVVGVGVGVGFSWPMMVKAAACAPGPSRAEPVCSRTNAETMPKPDNTDGFKQLRKPDHTCAMMCTNPSVREQTPKQGQNPTTQMASKQLRKPNHTCARTRLFANKRRNNVPITLSYGPFGISEELQLQLSSCSTIDQ